LVEMAALLRGPDWTARLGTPARDLPPRQRTLENVIAWSYDLLDKEERAFFARLGVLNGWFDLAAAAALAEVSQERALQLLNELAGHSLLLRETRPGGACWRMLEIIREYAASRLPRRAQVEEARAGYFLARMRDLRQKTSLAACEEDFQANLQNYHAVLAWCAGAGRPDLGLQIAFELEGVWSSQGYFREGLDFFRRLLDQPGEVAPAVRANAMRAASDQAWQQHDFETALWFARQAVDLGQAYGLTQENPHYLNRLGRIYIEQGDYPRAREAIGEALALAWQPGSSLPPGRPLAQLGEIALFEGDLDQADALLSQAIDLLLPEDGVFYAIAATDLAEVMLARGDYPRALGWLRAACPAASGHIRRLIVFLGALAGCLVRSAAGSAASAAALYGAIESLCEHSGVVLGEFYRRANREGMRLARQNLSARQWAGAYEMGRAYNKAQAARRAADLLDLPSG
nr:tetratricopeptide repeat protein [Anaerolinea sp.]